MQTVIMIVALKSGQEFLNTLYVFHVNLSSYEAYKWQMFLLK